MGKVTFLIASIGVIVFMMVFVGCSDTGLKVIADEPIKVFKDYPASGPPDPNKAFAILNKGETADLIKTRYSKDFMFYRIRLQDKREGYIQFGDKFRVIPKSPATS